LDNEKLHKLYSLSITIRANKSEDEMGGACNMHGGEREKCTQNLVGKPEVKRPFGTAGNRWEENVKMDFKETHVMMWILWIL
jgi:hypothetical protein